MPKTPPRKYEKIDEAEIDLVLKCNDGHEFYERYREIFPNRKKGIESISKIWKRRNEFVKKRLVTEPPEVPDSAPHELSHLISTQNRILTELSAVMSEQLAVSRHLLTILQRVDRVPEEKPPKSEELKMTDHKNTGKKTAEKANDIMIGS